MKNRLYRAANKALTLLLMASILGTGAFAVHLTHVSAVVSITFGNGFDYAKPIKIADLITSKTLGR